MLHEAWQARQVPEPEYMPGIHDLWWGVMGGHKSKLSTWPGEEGIGPPLGTSPLYRSRRHPGSRYRSHSQRGRPDTPSRGRN